PFLFFFSSRRRHTRFSRDWSSDVCSSDLGIGDFALLNPGAAWPNKRWPPESFASVAHWIHAAYGWTPVVLWGPGEESIADAIVRSEERRVGKSGDVGGRGVDEDKERARK